MNNIKRILLVDDEEVITFGFTLVLNEPGVVVDSANTIEAATELIEANNYDAVIVDLRLSNSLEIEGFTCIRLLRQRKMDCRIIVLTAYGDKQLRDVATSLGVDMFLEKPIEPEEIKETLRAFGIYDKSNSVS